MSWTDAWPALAMLVAIATLPWLVRMAKARGWIQIGQQGQVATVLSVSPLSPQQKVVTLEVKHGEHHRILLLGVTAQSVCVLDSWSPPPPQPTHSTGVQLES